MHIGIGMAAIGQAQECVLLERELGGDEVPA